MPGPESLSPNDPTAFGDYSVVGRLGRGGQGIVYLARDLDGDEYAVKVLNEEWSQDTDLRKRFEKEVRAAQKVASFCTAAIHEANLDAEPPYVVSEYVPGPSLQEAVAKEGPRKGAALQRLAVSTATALVAIHQAGIVHRDFKPGNVLLGPDGPRVIDFGIARVVDGTATMTNSIVGTPSYMAPEQIEGRGITDKVDVFAWGCVMAYASTGHAPFGADSVPAVVHRVISAPPELTGVTGPLRTIIEDCLNKDANRRPTAQQLLMRLLGHEDTAAAPSTDEVVAEGERIAEHGGVSGPQFPPYGPTPSGPQTPFPYGTPPHGGMGARPLTGPQAPQNNYGPPQHRPMGQQMPGPANPGVTGHMGMAPPPPMTGPNTRYPGHPMHTQAPRPPMPPKPAVRPNAGRTEDPVLSQGWVIPAVLIAIIILLLLLFLVALSG
ncbi:serine/threonine-protein kinase [Marinitenerispora sediminis]|uniref:Serine/threonine protein kinase n=1 Tax=Marinitenerispora sediminis TaxID=1931232 RepID=A0A368T8Z8_9ACTN|nr:serine/threonine-protein kinase [Marinitenerispora sediminis]RCV55687.1 serine/threonine protein kinase [Marinitenerispora sediminis]RCV60911.1 serine/threonine protein kinase [Marinitenerispora sediminis]